jgi:hypothetical protein
MKKIKTLEQVDPDCYYGMLALLYKIKPEDKDDFIKRMKTYSNKLKREEIGGNKFIHLIKMIDI